MGGNLQRGGQEVRRRPYQAVSPPSALPPLPKRSDVSSQSERRARCTTTLHAACAALMKAARAAEDCGDEGLYSDLVECASLFRQDLIRRVASERGPRYDGQLDLLRLDASGS